MEEQPWLKSRRHDHFIRPPHVSSTAAVEDALQKSYSVNKKRRIILIMERLVYQLSNPAIVDRINVDDQRGSEELANLLYSVLAERQIVAGNRISSFQLNHPPRRFLSFLTHDVLCCGDSGFPNSQQKVLHGRSESWPSTWTRAFRSDPGRKASYCNQCRGGSSLQRK